MVTAYPPPVQRRLITLFALAGAFMTQLDTTIANVALPHMQASTSASREQVTWVLTSYIVTAAIFTPLSGWLAGRIGRKLLFLISLVGFTVASVMCGLAANFEQLVGFRILQGVMGASLLPMSQAIMLDITPPERHGSAMAIWGMGAILGPIVGPLAGGWLTENLSWRWVFLINVPFGIAAFAGIMLVLDETRAERPPRLDLTGFALLGLAIGSFQLMLDRGQMLDWFQSNEIRLEAVVSGLCLWLFVVHSLTTSRPFVPPALFKDRNYLIGSVLGVFIGGLMYGVIALVAPMLAELMGYPIELVGMVTAPRGIATLLVMPLAGRLADRVDPRLMILFGIVTTGMAMLILSHSTLDMDSTPVIVAGAIQGIGTAFMFVPVTIIVFATIDPRLRNEGAAFGSLVRNLGASVWISTLQTMTIRNEAIVHSRLVESVRPDNPAVIAGLPDFDFSAVERLARFNAEISRQALMVAYADAFWTMVIASVIVLPLVILVRKSR